MRTSNRTHTAVVFGALAVFLWGVSAAIGAEPSVEEIVRKTNHVAYYQGRDSRAEVRMTITDDQGRTRNREFTILRSDALPDGSTEGSGEDGYTGDQKFYVYFTHPADVNKMAFLVHKHVGGDDDRWLYVPGLDLVKRIASTEKRTSFVGSDFFYEDVSGRSINEDVHEIADTTEEHYVLKNTPKKPDNVEFAYFKMWIRKDSFVVDRIEYYDEKDNTYRIYAAEKVETIQGYPTVTRSSMGNTVKGTKTVIEYSGVKYDIDLPDKVFTERYLRRPPRQYLK